jgi:dTDP-glucose 4,6-dehydratase
MKWQPKIDFTKGINLTFDWYLNNNAYYKSLSKKDILKRLGVSND